MFTRWQFHKRYRGASLQPRGRLEASVTDRQELVPGFDQSALTGAEGTLIGAGGIGSEVGEALVGKGIGYLRLYDGDTVELSNLSRQYFFRRDIGKLKGPRLARNLAARSTCGTIVEGFGLSFQDAAAAGVFRPGTFAVCGVDNNRTRVDVCRYYLEQGTPVLFIAVDLVAESGYVFVQQPGQACFVCAFPNALKPSKLPCRTPAVKDILKVVAGLAVYAVDTLLMPGRKRNWNYRNCHLAGFAPSEQALVERRPDCPVCGHG